MTIFLDDPPVEPVTFGMSKHSCPFSNLASILHEKEVEGICKQVYEANLKNTPRCQFILPIKFCTVRHVPGAGHLAKATLALAKLCIFLDRYIDGGRVRDT